jgi:hypothetical protein
MGNEALRVILMRAFPGARTPRGRSPRVPWFPAALSVGLRLCRDIPQRCLTPAFGSTVCGHEAVSGGCGADS